MSRSRDTELIDGETVEFRRTRSGYTAYIKSMGIQEEGKTREEAKNAVIARLVVSSVPSGQVAFSPISVRNTVPTEGRMAPSRRLAH